MKAVKWPIKSVYPTSKIFQTKQIYVLLIRKSERCNNEATCISIEARPAMNIYLIRNCGIFWQILSNLSIANLVRLQTLIILSR